jgi:hypothetical protein
VAKVRLGIGASRCALWLLIYSSLAIVAAYLLGAIWGAGSSTMPLAAGVARGKRFSGSCHQDRGVFIRADRYCFFHAGSLGLAHWRYAIANLAK